MPDLTDGDVIEFTAAGRVLSAGHIIILHVAGQRLYLDLAHDVKDWRVVPDAD